jgi:hypothetical protein
MAFLPEESACAGAFLVCYCWPQIYLQLVPPSDFALKDVLRPPGADPDRAAAANY